ncbi:membrane hypothetical protein [Rhodospirillaceae bacterium LM-1]|nr:membrane hypothetical protein [Rhodospirillaceae bacterium LM-1]
MRGLSFNLLLFWHGLFAGSYIVAFLTGDDAMGMHIASGWFVILLGAFRLLAALLVSDKSPWSLPWPNATQIKAFRRQSRDLDPQALQGRNMLLVASGLIVLMGAVLASLSGYLPSDDLHEGIANLSLAFVLGHAALVLISQGMKRVKAAVLPAPAKPLVSPTAQSRAPV